MDGSGTAVTTRLSSVMLSLLILVDWRRKKPSRFVAITGVVEVIVSPPIVAEESPVEKS